MEKTQGALDFFNPLLYRRADTGAPRNRASRTEKAAKPAFSSLLDAVTHNDALEDAQEPPASAETVTALLDEIHAAGDELAEKPFLDEIKRYKHAVHRFMHYIVENGFGVEGEMGIPHGQKPGFKGIRGSPEAKERTLHTRIKVVDDKLEKLAADIINGQAARLDLLGRVEEINGLLVDMLE